jgi:uncharacterized membrane protein YccC
LLTQEADIMGFIEIWVAVWTTIGSIAAVLLTMIQLWSSFFLRRAPDPVPGLLEAIRDFLREIRDDRTGFRGDLRNRFDTLEDSLWGANEAAEARFQSLLEALAAHRHAVEEDLQTLADSFGDRLERIEEELRRRNAQSERDVLRPVAPGEWCTLM